MGLRGPKPRPVVDRFWAKVDKNGPNGCWLWMGSRTSNGYGRIKPEGGGSTNLVAHRFSFSLVHGEIPPEMDLDHLCRNPPCVNPDHLEVVTTQMNLLRGIGFPAVHARKTHCPQGHPYDLLNTRIARGRRYCRICDKLAHRRKYQQALMTLREDK